jgi:catalase
MMGGEDPDFNHRDLWGSIEAVTSPSTSPGCSSYSESQEHDFDFDPFDATKIIPEDRLPVRPVGRMVLNP